MTRLEIATAILAAHLGDHHATWVGPQADEEIALAFSLAEKILGEEQRRKSAACPARGDHKTFRVCECGWDGEV